MKLSQHIKQSKCTDRGLALESATDSILGDPAAMDQLDDICDVYGDVSTEKMAICIGMIRAYENNRRDLGIDTSQAILSVKAIGFDMIMKAWLDSIESFVTTEVEQVAEIPMMPLEGFDKLSLDKWMVNNGE